MLCTLSLKASSVTVWSSTDVNWPTILSTVCCLLFSCSESASYFRWGCLAVLGKPVENLLGLHAVLADLEELPADILFLCKCRIKTGNYIVEGVCWHRFDTVAALHQGASGQMTCLEDLPPWLLPWLHSAYCFASVIVWKESKNFYHIWPLTAILFYFDSETIPEALAALCFEGDD